MSLSKQEISARMVELSNLRRLYATQKTRLGMFKSENKKLKERVAFLETAYAGQQTINADLRLQMEELRTIVFGRKRKNNDHDIDDTPPAHRMPRTPDSYKRPLPKEADVTEIKDYPIDVCTRCHGSFSEQETVTYFEEDIPLPQKKTVIKHTIEKGYCGSCKRWNTSVPLPTTSVVLGNNVKRYVTYLSVCARQSYAQIQDILVHTYEFDISQGEIAKILEKESNRMRPEYERLKARIRGEPSVHLDETGWDLLIGDGYRRYAWTMVGGNSRESVFVLGKTRGKGNATDLLGDSEATVVSDDYAVYRNLANDHQLCCSHILHKLRDLARSREITGETHDHCVLSYTTFASIYADVRHARISAHPADCYDALLAQLHTFALPHPLDFAKLSRIKKQVAERAERYLTCLLRPCASDNNAAERSLRHLVLKRKISFGSFSEKTAETLAILLSVLMSCKQRGTLRNYLAGV